MGEKLPLENLMNL